MFVGPQGTPDQQHFHKVQLNHKEDVSPDNRSLS